MFLLLCKLGYTQTTYESLIALPHPDRLIDSIPPGKDTIKLAPADHWRTVMPGPFFQRDVYHLVKAAGCYDALGKAQKVIENQDEEIKELRAANAIADTTDQLTDEIDQNEKELTKKEKTRAWFRKAKDKIIIVAVSTLAAIEAALLIKKELEQ